jgi:hypothetical protein
LPAAMLRRLTWMEAEKTCTNYLSAPTRRMATLVRRTTSGNRTLRSRILSPEFSHLILCPSSRNTFLYAAISALQETLGDAVIPAARQSCRNSSSRNWRNAASKAKCGPISRAASINASTARISWFIQTPSGTDTSPRPTSMRSSNLTLSAASQSSVCN